MVNEKIALVPGYLDGEMSCFHINNTYDHLHGCYFVYLVLILSFSFFFYLLNRT